MNKEIFEHKHICLVVDHYNPLGIIRSLGEEGIRPIVLLCSPHPILVQHSKYIGELHTFNTIDEGYEFLVSHYGNETPKPFVYHGSDDITMLLDKHYEEIKDKFYFTNGQGELAKKYLQKYDNTELAFQCGVAIPKQVVLKVGEMPTSLKYPVITKAVTSTGGDDWKKQSFICENESELKEAYSKIKADKILVQEYILKKNELCIDGISINAGEQVFMPYGCQYYDIPEGSFSHYMCFTPFLDKDLTEKIVKIMRGAKYSGIFNIEFLIGQDDEIYFLEINFRHSAWSYAYTYGGFNLILRWAVSTLDNKLYLDDFKYLESFNVMEEFSDFKERALSRKVSLSKWIKEVKNCDCFLVYNKRDKKPFWSLLRYKLRALRNKMLHI